MINIFNNLGVFDNKKTQFFSKSDFLFVFLDLKLSNNKKKSSDIYSCGSAKKNCTLNIF